MAVEPFAFCQGDHGLAGGLQGCLVEADQARVAQEGFDAEGAGKAGGAGGGQGVVWTRQVIPYRFRGVGADENGSGVVDAIGEGLGIGHKKFQVLRGKAVAESCGLFQIGTHHD